MKSFSKPTVKEPSMTSLIVELDILVSQFVRMSAADENGRVHCISCDDVLFWKHADCAHFIERGRMSTRYYLPNLAPACRNCNRYNIQAHLTLWALKMKPEVIDELRIMEKNLAKFTRGELLGMIEEYKVLNANLRKKF